MTVREMLHQIEAMLDNGDITYDTRVVLGDDKRRDESVDPITCYELVPSGPAEYDWREISYENVCKLRKQKKHDKYVNSTRVETGNWAAAAVGLVNKKLKFADSKNGEVCLAFGNAAASIKKRSKKR